MDAVEIKTESTNDDPTPSTPLPKTQCTIKAEAADVSDNKTVEIKTEYTEEVQIEPANDDPTEAENNVADNKIGSEIKIENIEIESTALTGPESPINVERPADNLEIKTEAIDIGPTMVSESDKLYDIKRLREFGDVPFVIKRMEPQDFAVSYRKAMSSIEVVLQRLRLNHVPNGAGIAFRIAHHTPSSCILILAILNHKCHFYATDKMMMSKALKQQLCRAGIEYLLASGHMAIGAAYFERIDSFLVYNEEYKLLRLKRAADDPPQQNAAPLPPNMCYSITTTGSTGEPKLVHVPYECIAPNILALSQRLQISMADIIYLGTPCTFDPFVVELFLALQNGAAVLVSHYSMRESPTRVLSALFPTVVTTPGITVLQMTPSLFRQFGCTAIRERILSSASTLRVLLLGGEPFPCYDELINWMQPKVLLQKLVCNVYGITEQSCWSTLHILRSLHARVPLGTPLDDQTLLRIDYKRNRELHNAGSGELLLGSRTRRCYIPELDDLMSGSREDEDCCFRATGDWVRRYENGAICYEQRSNDMVKRAGNRICLGVITRKIQDSLLAHELATCLWQEQLQKLICCIRISDPKTKLQQRTQTYDILSKLMAAEQPDRFVYLQHFPFNAHGKLDRVALLKECVPLTQPGQEILKTFLHDTLECVDTSAQTERTLKKQRLEQMPARPSGFELSFRQAGGSSFHAITLSREIGVQMCIDDEQRHLFELLLDETVPLRAVLAYLDAVKLVANNTKLKPIETPLCSTASSSAGSQNLLITRIEQPAIHFQVHWQVGFGKCVDSPVAQLDDRYVCVGAHSKLLRTLDARTGRILSSTTLPDRIECRVSFSDAQLAMVGCYDGCLYGFQPLTGALVWRVEIGGMIKASPLLTANGSRIVVCSYANDYNVMCLDAKQQSVLWCMRIGSKPIFAAPLELPNQQATIVCTLDGGCARILLSTGAVQWVKKFKDPFFATPALLDDQAQIFLCAEVAGRVHACQTSSGEILASYAVEGNIFSSLLVKAPPTHMGQTFVLFGCIDKHLYCLRCRTRSGESVEFELHWKLEVGSAIYATPILLALPHTGYLVCCCATNGRVVLTNLTDGQMQWTGNLPGEIFSTPCYIEGLRRIYVGCRDNNVYCLGI